MRLFHYVFISAFSLISSLLAEDSVKPIYHWPMENNGIEAMREQETLLFVGRSFSEDCVEGSYALICDNTVKDKQARAFICKMQQISAHFMQEGYEQRTFSLWFKAIRPSFHTDIQQVLLDVGDWEDGGLVVYILGATLYVGMGVLEGLNEITLETAITLEKWHQVLVSFDRGKVTLYLDGQLVEEAIFENLKEMPMIERASVIGAGAGYTSLFLTNKLNYNSFNGLMDDVRIYHVALSEEDVHNLFKRKPLMGIYDPPPNIKTLSPLPLTILDFIDPSLQATFSKGVAEEVISIVELFDEEAFKPIPEVNTSLDMLQSDESGAQAGGEFSPAALKSGKHTRTVMIVLVFSLGVLGLLIACIMGYRSMRS